MPKLNAPCFRCENHSSNCHSDCEKYKAYKAEMSERQALKAKATNDGEYRDYICRLHIKNKKSVDYKNKRKGT